ncbi:ABC transporter G family member 23 [Folsomia candida]|uniref:ABC transporter G family member 23 n=1 Tax=Folsomia candida TaxID=158441 RepID=A0A226ECI7_FOLCA|nr:ABC transporter G family member 23 [Folsomia candida]
MAVVQIRNGYKSYNSEGYVLRNLSMDVHRGEIYGLLGASGCGKTTLISCLVGLRQFDRGQFAVFGRPGGDVLGKLGGYMPQDISLQLFLTIEESLTYYGMIYGLKNQEIENRIKFLTKFLDLKSSRMNIGCLSGGQKLGVPVPGFFGILFPGIPGKRDPEIPGFEELKSRDFGIFQFVNQK